MGVELEAASAGASASTRVLVVEDDPGVMRTIVRALSPEWDTVSARNGQAALEAFREGHFDVLVSDIAMPTMDGLALLEKVRHMSDDIPVILITGNPSVESAIDAVELRAFKYLPKPFDPETLRDVVREAVAHARMARMRRQALEVASHRDARDLQRLHMELQRARETLWLAYQPIVDAGRRVVGYEALLRWHEGDFRGPRELLSAAEELGEAEELGRQIWVLAPRPFASRPGTLLFVNVEPAEMGHPYMRAREDTLARMASRVVLELTEHTSLKDVADVGRAIFELKSVGYRLAVDDLGAGYSGLSSFAHIGPDFVKLDRSLVDGVRADPDKQRVIRGISRLCHELEMTVIAEGVEHRDDLSMLVTLECDLFQGYLLGRPEPLPAGERQSVWS